MNMKFSDCFVWRCFIAPRNIKIKYYGLIYQTWLVIRSFSLFLTFFSWLYIWYQSYQYWFSNALFIKISTFTIAYCPSIRKKYIGKISFLFKRESLLFFKIFWKSWKSAYQLNILPRNWFAWSIISRLFVNPTQ